MPPVLNARKSKVDGLAFIGLSLARKSEEGHPDSETHQESFDLNEVLDRDYEFLASSNDDGWLVGGGEPGPPRSYKLAAKDSAHVELIRIGTYEPTWGGVALETILEVMGSGKIMIPQIEVLPTAVVANPDKPPELEIRFDMEPPYAPHPRDDELPINWQLRFLHNQLFRALEYPSRFCPGAFHSTILRKAEFRSPTAEKQYFEKCEQALEAWRIEGPKPLNTVPRNLKGEVMTDTQKTTDEADAIGTTEYNSGIWLFTDRENISHFFAPNFLPPYDTPEKKKIICQVLAETWDEKSLSWKPTPKKPQPLIRNLMESDMLKKREPIGEPNFDSNVSIQLMPSGKFLSVSNNGKLVLMGRWHKPRCTFALFRQRGLFKDDSLQDEEAIGLKFLGTDKWVGLNMFGGIHCASKKLDRREAWNLEDDYTNTPLMCMAAGWGKGSYIHVEDNTISFVELKDRKRAAMWCIKNLEDE